MYFPLEPSDNASEDRVESNPDFYKDQGALEYPVTTYWFWNSRLIPRASLDFWSFFKHKRDKSVPKECFSIRTRVFAFVDSSVGVAKNKVYLDLESPLLKELAKANSASHRKNVEDLHKFIEYCHVRYDLEAEWRGVGLIQDTKTFYQEVLMQGKIIKVKISTSSWHCSNQFMQRGVMVKLNNKKFGWIESLYEDHNGKKTKMARIIPWAGDRSANSKIPSNELVDTPLLKLSILTPDQWEAEVEKAREQYGKELVFADVIMGSKSEKPICLVCLHHVTKRELKCKSCKASFHRRCYTMPQEENKAYKESLDDLDNTK